MKKIVAKTKILLENYKRENRLLLQQNESLMQEMSVQS